MSKSNAILAEMQKEIWAMEPRALNALFTRLIEIEISAPKDVEVIKESKLAIIGDTAVIAVKGILLKNIPSLYRWLGIEMTSYLDIQSQIAEALSNQAIKKILLDIDSPGGIVAGVMETGQAIANAAGQKQVTAKIDDLGASGAYWLASQATKVIAGPNAEVGAIGVFTVYMDLSAKAEKEGIKIHVIRSGEHKGMGVPGDKITPEQLAAVQQIIDGMADNFIKAVSSGRDMTVEEVRTLADGRIFLAADAKKNGLIDNVITGKPNKFKEKNTMSETEPDKTAERAEIAKNAEAVKKQTEEGNKRRLAELKKEFPDEPQFVLEQFEKEATLEQAKAAFADVLKTRNSELRRQNEELAKKNKKKADTDGAPPIPPGGEGNAGGEDFMMIARERAKEDKCSMTEAMKKVKKENPELHEAYLQKQPQKQQE